MGKRRGDGGGEELVRSRVCGRGAVLLIWRGKGGRGAELAVAEGAPLLCTFGERNGDEDVTVGTGGERAVEVGRGAGGVAAPRGS